MFKVVDISSMVSVYMALVPCNFKIPIIIMHLGEPLTLIIPCEQKCDC